MKFDKFTLKAQEAIATAQQIGDGQIAYDCVALASLERSLQR